MESVSVCHAHGVCLCLVAVLNVAFCMTCSLLMLVKDARGDHMEKGCSRDGLIPGCALSGCPLALGHWKFGGLLEGISMFAHWTSGNKINKQ